MCVVYAKKELIKHYIYSFLSLIRSACTERIGQNSYNILITTGTRRLSMYFIFQLFDFRISCTDCIRPFSVHLFFQLNHSLHYLLLLRHQQLLNTFQICNQLGIGCIQLQRRLKICNCCCVVTCFAQRRCSSC